MTTPKHTPTPRPWQVQKYEDQCCIYEYKTTEKIQQEIDNRIVHTWHRVAMRLSEQDAALIVEAVNAHDTLVAQRDELAEALKELLSTVNMYREDVYRRGDGTASNECVNMLSACSLKAINVLAKVRP